MGIGGAGGQSERGWWPRLDLTLPPHPRTSLPGFLAALPVSDSGSHRGKVVSVALGSHPAYRWGGSPREVDIGVTPCLGGGWP